MEKEEECQERERSVRILRRQRYRRSSQPIFRLKVNLSTETFEEFIDKKWDEIMKQRRKSGVNSRIGQKWDKNKSQEDDEEEQRKKKEQVEEKSADKWRRKKNRREELRKMQGTTVWRKTMGRKGKQNKTRRRSSSRIRRIIQEICSTGFL